MDDFGLSLRGIILHWLAHILKCDGHEVILQAVVPAVCSYIKVELTAFLAEAHILVFLLKYS